MEISNYLEIIRYGRKMTQEDFVDGICSLRQYQRYRNGECEITYEKIDQFAYKLGIPTKKLMHEFEKDNNLQYRLINEYYNAVVNNDVVTANEIKMKIESTFIFSEERRMYYQHAMIMSDLLQKKISNNDAVRKSEQLIGYPSILKQNFLTDIETLVLSFMLGIIGGDERNKILKKLTNMYDNPDSIMSGGGGSHIHFLILMRLAKAHGILKNNLKVIQLCDLGIQKGILYKQYYLMEYFFYFKALSHFKLEEFELYEEALFRCYNVLHMEGNKKKIDKFTSLIESDFKIVYDMFILRYLKKSIV
jgi:transcriptional regulator with XRE-family HTH domain